MKAIILLCIAIVLSGCTSQEQINVPIRNNDEIVIPTIGTAQRENWTESFPFHGHLTLGVSTPIYYIAPLTELDSRYHPFDVYDDATLIVVEVAWANSIYDLDIQVVPPSCDSAVSGCYFNSNGTYLKGDSPVRFEVNDYELLQETGVWAVIIWAKDGVNVDYDGVTTVNYRGFR